MDLERRVEDRRASRQVEDPSVPQEHEDALAQELAPDRLDEFLRRVDLVLPVFDRVEPRHRVRLRRHFRGPAVHVDRAQIGRAALEAADAAPACRVLRQQAVLVEPVRGHAVLGDLVHPSCSNLNLHDLVLGHAVHGRVERLVAVGLRERDVVLDARHRRAALEVPDLPQHVVAQVHAPLAPRGDVLGRAARHVQDDAHRDDVLDRVEVVRGEERRGGGRRRRRGLGGLGGLLVGERQRRDQLVVRQRPRVRRRLGVEANRVGARRLVEAGAELVKKQPVHHVEFRAVEPEGRRVYGRRHGGHWR
mmetsp:Transcript_25147/g.78454  ORF Transcript_25147/g.78454 Transcript_25147/m.78454 type:complete len:305 (+) Transcript_25147:273-1187(+)